MKLSKTIAVPVLAGFVLLTAAAGKTTGSSGRRIKKNKVAGCWTLISGNLENHGNRIPIFGPHPGGMVIFSEDLHFIVVINNPDIPKFVSGDRSKGTPEEYKSAVTNSLGVYGTYTVDENGDFAGQHILGSTFQNLNGIARGVNELTEIVDGNSMTERLKITDEISVKLVWQRAQ